MSAHRARVRLAACLVELQRAEGVVRIAVGELYPGRTRTYLDVDAPAEDGHARAWRGVLSAREEATVRELLDEDLRRQAQDAALENEMRELIPNALVAEVLDVLEGRSAAFLPVPFEALLDELRTHWPALDRVTVDRAVEVLRARGLVLPRDPCAPEWVWLPRPEGRDVTAEEGAGRPEETRC